MPDKKSIVGIKVRFQLNTKDGLRRVIFGLEKETTGTKVDWTITFQLFERDKKTDPFGDALVDLNVEVDTELHADAEEVAKAQRLSTGQKTHALTTAADDAKAAKDGEIDQEEADESVQDTLAS